MAPVWILLDVRFDSVHSFMSVFLKCNNQKTLYFFCYKLIKTRVFLVLFFWGWVGRTLCQVQQRLAHSSYKTCLISQTGPKFENKSATILIGARSEPLYGTPHYTIYGKKFVNARNGSFWFWYIANLKGI